jgi:amino acid transporter
MSEEVEDAAITVPRSMVATVLLNGGLGFGMLIAILFSMGSTDEALRTETGYPIIQIVFNAVEDKLATSAIISILIAMFVFATVGIMASSSRLTWAFARDKGLPFSAHLARIHPRFKLPLNAIILTAIINLLLSLINIASVTAFNAMLSLAIISLYLTYIAPVILIFYLRIRYPTSIEWGPFRMGRIGPAVNMISIMYMAYA